MTRQKLLSPKCKTNELFHFSPSVIVDFLLSCGLQDGRQVREICWMETAVIKAVSQFVAKIWKIGLAFFSDVSKNSFTHSIFPHSLMHMSPIAVIHHSTTYSFLVSSFNLLTVLSRYSACMRSTTLGSTGTYSVGGPYTYLVQYQYCLYSFIRSVVTHSFTTTLLADDG